MTHHDAMVYDAKKAPNDLDIVFVGDSIAERWNGTAALGTKVIDSTKRAFRKRFTKKYGGKLEGIALGSAGDTVSPMCVCVVVLYICLWRQKWSPHVFVHVRTNMKCSGTQPALASEKRCSGASRSKSLVYTYRFQRSLYE